ncbi:MAG: DUF3558 family protein [Saccharothrix sp.]|nr:DUF3558 family protein [Saccharothrix sp.]
MTRHAPAALAAVALLAACTPGPTPPPTSPPATPPATAASGWDRVPDPHAEAEFADLATGTPLRFPEGDVCALLTEQEIVTTIGVPHARPTGPPGPRRCTWQVGDGTDDRGRQRERLIVDGGGIEWWTGPEQGTVAGHPARRVPEDGWCLLRVALHEPVDDTDETAVLQVSLQRGNLDTCAAAQALAELLMTRMPS